MSAAAVRALTTQLAEARRALGWSQQQLANRLYVSRTSLVKWESGQRTPEVGALLAWADAVGFEITITPKKEAAKC